LFHLKKLFMKKWNLVMFGLMALLLTACEKVTGDGPLVTQNRTHTAFSGVDLRMNATVVYKQAPDYKIEVRAQDNIQGILITEVENGKLVVRVKNDVRLRRHEPITITVQSPELNRLRVSGSGNITATGLLNADDLEVDISGSGDIELADLVARYLDVDISGSGDFKVVSGMAPEELLRISGSGDIDVANVLAKSVISTTSGSGTTRVNVSEQLRVTISGSGNVHYKGQPSLSVFTSGSGKVRPM
jgi:hypothetical protein